MKVIGSRDLLLAVLLLPTLNLSAHADFIGELVLEPSGCEQTESCTLAADFGYIDQRGVGWKADKGDRTDGASIPRWAQKFVGVPFEPSALPAAVLHDHYSKSVRPVRGWFDTQRMFYQALLEGGVAEPRASLMYAGVLIGSGKWITRMEGKPCDLGDNVSCVNQTVELTLETEQESYGTEAFAANMTGFQELIEGGMVGQEAVEAMVRSAFPDDIYLQNPTGIIIEDIEVGIYAIE